MRTKFILAFVSVTALTFSAFAQPKCNHKLGGSMFASTNPVKAVKSAGSSDSGTAMGATGSK